MGSQGSKQKGGKMKLKTSDLKNVQRQTNLDKVEIKDVYNVFVKVAPEGAVDREQFKESLEILEQSGLKRIARTPYADRLFSLLDKNGDGVVDFKEFVSGFALLCKGTPEDKIRVSFSAYDKDGNGQISRPELEEMFKSAWMAGFKTMSSTDLDESELSVQEINDFCEDCAKTFASNVLEQMDTDGDGQLSYDEFKEFALQEPKITACLNDFVCVPLSLPYLSFWSMESLRRALPVAGRLFSCSTSSGTLEDSHRTTVADLEAGNSDQHHVLEGVLLAGALQLKSSASV